MEKRLIDLETKSMFQEDMIQSLSQTIVEIHETIRRLETRIKLIEDKIEADPIVKKQEDETPPPHY